MYQIDVEGSELGILQGLSEDVWQLIENIVAEVHEVCEKLHNGSLQHKDVIDHLLRTKGKFEYISWVDATPTTQCEASNSQNAPRNFMVYASRLPFFPQK